MDRKKADTQKRRLSLSLTSQRQITGEQIRYIVKKQNNKLHPALKKKNLQFVIFSRVTDSTICPENNPVSEVDARVLQ